ncbi:MAG: 50S ribosomal protein L9 [candidate division Zixibacteria bacterium]|nr:50S ribosomal protein L9 [candidate division Zixibacteria bacterium]
MKVILREDMDNLGKCGEIVEVADGYGRNFLIARNLAIPATRGNVKAIDEVSKQKEMRDRKNMKEAERVKARIEKASIMAEVNVGEEDKVFGSVTAAMISELLSKEGITVDRRNITLEEPIKSLGVFTVPVKIASDVVASLKLWVVKKSS